MIDKAIRCHEPLKINGLVTSSDFPRDSFESVHRHLVAFQKQPAHSKFIGAWHAISYRHQAVVEYDEWFTASILQHGPGPGHPERYRQERDLFGFFASGTSLFDAFGFGLYAVGQLMEPSHVPVEEEQRINWQLTSRIYKAIFPNDKITSVLDDVWNDPAFLDLRKIRNVLTHRAIPPRHHRMSRGAELVGMDIPLDRETTAQRRREVSRLLLASLNAAKEFVEARC